MINALTIFVAFLSVINCSRYDNITGQGVLETLIDDIVDLRQQFNEEVKTLKSQFYRLNKTVSNGMNQMDDRTEQLFEYIKKVENRLDEQETWHLGMNLNPADGHVMGYGTGWHTGESIGSEDTALTKDFLSSSVWRQPANYIAIVRHHAGVMDAVKVWKFNNPGVSLLERFRAMNPGRIIATTGGPIQTFFAKNTTNATDDSIFSVDGDLALNWGYSNNGCRMALTGGHLSGANSNDDNTHGLGNNFDINPKYPTKTSSSKKWMHEISNIQDCPNPNCKKVLVQGTDHGPGSKRGFKSGPVYGNYAIYVSKSESRFPVEQASLEL